MTSVTKTIKQKLFYSAMVFAFMWVITGDLVSIHLKVIFGDKVKSDWHQPYTKTHKDDSTYKVQKSKTDGSSKVKHLSFIGSDVLRFSLTSNDYNYQNSNTQILRLQKLGFLFLRGPPSLA